jgi:diguanylate cyclase (GGDEF)-like protein
MKVGFYLPWTRIWIGIDSRMGIDPLTRTLNREALCARLDQLAKAKQGVGIVFIDVDDFKKHNTTLGHPVADLVLETLPKRCLQVLKPHDQIGRWGGDEFVVIVLDVTKEQLDEITDRLMMQFVQPMVLTDPDLQVPISPIDVSITAAGTLLDHKSHWKSKLLKMSNKVLKAKQKRSEPSRLMDVLVPDRRTE